MGILCFGRRLLPAAGAFFFWLGALPFPGRANDQQEALELLQQVGETYANLTSYHFRAHDRSETEAGGRTRKIQRVFETIVDASSWKTPRKAVWRSMTEKQAGFTSSG